MAAAQRDRRSGRDSPIRNLAVLVAVVLVGCGAIFVTAAFADLTPEDDVDVVTPGDNGEVDLDVDDPLANVPGRTGGEAVFAAQGWPTCLNPILERCADEEWFHWTVGEHVLPKLMELDGAGNYVPSPLLVEAPTVANGGIVEEPFTITYRLDPEAHWEDGTPVTADDVAFTWRAHLQSPDGITRGYDLIETVEQPEPDLVMVRFSEPYASWPELFGGERDYVLKAAAFLSTDVGDALRDDIGFSGGPWLLEGWDEQAATLVPNPAYWDADRIPRLDRVSFVRREVRTTDPATLLAGDISVAFRPRVPDFERPEGDGEGDDVEFTVARAPSYEALWFNQVGPLADPAVREALTHALGRQVMLSEVIRPRFPELPLLQCVGWVPTVGPWCSEADYAQFSFDTARARRVLSSAGYASGPDGLFRDANGDRLRVRWTVDGNDEWARTIQAIGVFQAREAGIEIVPDNVDRATLLDERVPARDFEIALFGDVGHADPSVTDRLHCDAVPGPTDPGPDVVVGEPADGGSSNYIGWCNETASALMDESDRTVDPVKRFEIVREIGALAGADHVALPLVQRPALVVWDPDEIAGPIDAFVSSPYSAYWNMYAWGVAAAASSTPTEP